MTSRTRVQGALNGAGPVVGRHHYQTHAAGFAQAGDRVQAVAIGQKKVQQQQINVTVPIQHGAGGLQIVGLQDLHLGESTGLDFSQGITPESVIVAQQHLFRDGSRIDHPLHLRAALRCPHAAPHGPSPLAPSGCAAWPAGCARWPPQPACARPVGFSVIRNSE